MPKLLRHLLQRLLWRHAQRLGELGQIPGDRRTQHPPGKFLGQIGVKRLQPRVLPLGRLVQKLFEIRVGHGPCSLDGHGFRLLSHQIIFLLAHWRPGFFVNHNPFRSGDSCRQQLLQPLLIHPADRPHPAAYPLASDRAAIEQEKHPFL